MTVKINLGCGDNHLPDWENHDADVDITQPLPWLDNSADFILIEHCVEHVSYLQAVAFFKEAFRVLKIGGVLRVIVPSVTQILLCDDQEYFDWLKQKGWAPTADTRGALNAIIHQHGHQQAWTATLMEATLYACGFNSPRKCEPHWSSHPDLCNVDGHHKAIGEKFNKIESLVFEAAKSTNDLAKDYDENFFAMHQQWRGEYAAMARVLVDELPEFESVIDLGCGNGYLIDVLDSLGKQVMGYDGSSNVLGYRSDIIVQDITQPINCLPRDLVVCTEVAEHIEERFADALVNNVCRVARRTVFFSAANVGNGGHLHVNEQPRRYWIEKFGARGFVLDTERTQKVVARLTETNKKTWWFAKNCFVLTRTSLTAKPEAPAVQAPSQDPVTLNAAPARNRTAIVVGGSARLWDDVRQATKFCYDNEIDPEFVVTNDAIAVWRYDCVAATLHPDKLRGWMAQRALAALPAPSRIYTYIGGERKNHAEAHVTHRIRDWGGSSGMFGYLVARHLGHDKVILCGVPMTRDDGHFTRGGKWDAVGAFLRPWENRRAEMAPYVRSVSGGLTEEMFGRPSVEWITKREAA